MKIPRCCDEDMQRFIHVKEKKGKKGEVCEVPVWVCGECKKIKPVYRWPFTWFWLTVSRTDLDNQVHRKKLWLGHAASLFDYRLGWMVFTVMPLNLIIDAVVNSYKWCRHRKPQKWQGLLAQEFGKGRAQGHSEGYVEIFKRDRQIKQLEDELIDLKGGQEALVDEADALLKADEEKQEAPKNQIGQ